MSILAAATSRADFYTVGTAAAITTAAKIAPYAKEGVTVSDLSSYARLLFPALAEGWIRFHVNVNVAMSASVTGQMFRLKSGEAGQALFQLDFDGTAGNALEYWNGSAFVELAGETVTFSVARFKIDIQFKMDDSAGYVRVYVNDTLIHEMTGDTIFTAATTLDTIELSSPCVVGLGSGQYDFSGLIIADEDTRSMVFHQGQATANGADTAWTGVYTDVTKLDRNDNTFIESGTAAQLETYVMDDVHTDLAAYVPRAVVLSTRTRRGATGPQNMQGVVRQSGSDFTTSNISGINTAYGTRQAVMGTNPATSAAWTIAEINAAEFGVKSIA
jgi:hypothetical protein